MVLLSVLTDVFIVGPFFYLYTLKVSFTSFLKFYCSRLVISCPVTGRPSIHFTVPLERTSSVLRSVSSLQRFLLLCLSYFCLCTFSSTTSPRQSVTYSSSRLAHFEIGLPFPKRRSLPVWVNVES